MPDYDVIIIGGGPGGISALLWCQRLGLRGLLLEQAAEPGGQLLLIPDLIPDYPGLIAENGTELRDHFTAHLRQLQLTWQTACRVTEINVRNRTVLCRLGTLNAQALIIATGARKRWPGVPGEKEFCGRGIAEHALRAQREFAGQKVCVIGGGDSAFEDAFVLAQTCTHVTLIHHSDKYRARAAWIKRVLEHPRITVIPHVVVKEFQGDATGNHLAGVCLENLRTGTQERLSVQGAVVQIGVQPNTEFLAGQLALDRGGYLITDQRQRTQADMVYAIGDVTRPVCLSVATAVGHGAIAVRDIAESLRVNNTAF